MRGIGRKEPGLAHGHRRAVQRDAVFRGNLAVGEVLAEDPHRGNRRQPCRGGNGAFHTIAISEASRGKN